MKTIRFLFAVILWVTFGQFVSFAQSTQAEAFQAGKTVVLPPMVVQDVNLAIHKHVWSYVELPGFKIISCCPEGRTEDFLKTFYLRYKEFEEILPPMKQENEVTVILVDPEMEKAMGSELSDTMRKAGALSTGFRGSFDQIPQFTYVHEGSVVMIFTLDSSDYDDIVMTNNRVTSILANYSPRLPLWFIWGTQEFYQDTHWTGEAVHLPHINWPVDMTRVDKHRHYLPQPIIPFTSFFLGPFPGASQGSRTQFLLWVNQAKLLLHWAYAHGKKEQVWEFINRSSKELTVPSEALFTECFGMNFASMEKTLADYIQEVKVQQAKHSKFFKPELQNHIASFGTLPEDDLMPVLIKVDSLSLPKIDIHDATKVQAVTIKAAFTLEEVDFMRRFRPTVPVDIYVDQAWAQLSACYGQGVSDPDFMAVYQKYAALKKARPMQLAAQ